MTRARTADDWLREYGESHRNPVNKRLHYVCVPLIVWCVAGLLWSIPMPSALGAGFPWLNAATLAVLAALAYYAYLSLFLALGALPLLIAIFWSVGIVARHCAVPLWAICGLLFVLAWIGQFLGHAVEGKRPSFLKDVQFLMIGPLWLLADLYRRLGVRY
jgi:uncharacterized membrane protein YGL010W